MAKQESDNWPAVQTQ